MTGCDFPFIPYSTAIIFDNTIGTIIFIYGFYWHSDIVINRFNPVKIGLIIQPPRPSPEYNRKSCKVSSV